MLLSIGTVQQHPEVMIKESQLDASTWHLGCSLHWKRRQVVSVLDLVLSIASKENLKERVQQ